MGRQARQLHQLFAKERAIPTELPFLEAEHVRCTRTHKIAYSLYLLVDYLSVRVFFSSSPLLLLIFFSSFSGFFKFLIYLGKIYCLSTVYLPAFFLLFFPNQISNRKRSIDHTHSIAVQLPSRNPNAWKERLYTPT